MVPELHIAVAVAAGLAVRFAAAILGASVVVDLRTGTARAGSYLPEVVVFAQAYYALFGKAYLVAPDGEGLVVVLIYCSPDLILWDSEPFIAGNEFPAPSKRFSLEIVTEAEVSEHLEESGVPCCVADVVYIVGPDALLACGHPVARRLLCACKIWLEGRHAGCDEKKTLVVMRHERIAFMRQAALGLPELKEHGPDFVYSEILHVY